MLHTLDWQRAISNMMKTIATMQIKSSGLEDKKTTLASIKGFLAYVLVLMNTLLDVILSVAASVVFSRLLISGDIESNPGPGRCPGELRIFVIQYNIYMHHTSHINLHSISYRP